MKIQKSINNSHNIQHIIDTLSALSAGDEIFVSETELKAIQDMIEYMNFRIGEQVNGYVRYKSGYKNSSEVFELCPKCNAVLERTYQAYCINCGQKLKWSYPNKKMTEKL